MMRKIDGAGKGEKNETWVWCILNGKLPRGTWWPCSEAAPLPSGLTKESHSCGGKDLGKEDLVNMGFKSLRSVQYLERHPQSHQK